ncbi:MAG: hypothetical protein ACXWDL_02660 [Nocardioides sp.]
MEPRDETDGVYDVLLGSMPSESLRSRYATIAVQTTGTQTALWRRISGPVHLDSLLEKLCSLGIHLLDIHRIPGPAGEGGTYEVRVEGEVGRPVVGYLRWRHHVVPGQTRVRLAATSSELHSFLRACTERGVSIEGVRRVGLTPQVIPLR